MRDPKRRVDTLREKLSDGERGGGKVDHNALLEFSDRMKLQRERWGWFRHEKLLRHCTRMSEEVEDVDIVDAFDDRDTAEHIVTWIHDTYDIDETPETNQNYRQAIRTFGEVLTEEDGIPPSLNWISTTLPSSYDPSPDPAEMLDWNEDIVSMLEAARNPRDTAAIALQFDAGLRGGELYDLTVGAITESDHSYLVRVDGKTGERSVPIIQSIPYVTDWLGKHPGRDDADIPLWCRLDRPEQLSYRSFLDMFKDPAERAGVEKSVTPTNFRKSNATWLAKQGANAALIEDRQGRTRGSDKVLRYVAQFGEDAETAYAQLHGIEVDEESEGGSIAPVECPRCHERNPRHEPACVFCGQALSHEAAAEAVEQKRRAQETLAKLDPETANEVLDTVNLLTDPEVRAQLQALAGNGHD
jgi:integrase